MSRFANRLTRGLTPYTPGEQPQEQGLIKLNTNESPFPPGPAVRAAWEDFPIDRLRLYPDPEAVALRKALAQAQGLAPQEVFVGNGSDEILGFLFQTFFETTGKKLLMPDPSYSFYEVYCRRYGIPYQKIPLAGDLSINVEDYNQAGQAVILANPNAPTGCLLSLSAIARLCEQDPQRLVVIDEAYIDFAPAGSSAVSLLKEKENLLVVQTFSKSRSLAGLRVGMAYAKEDLIGDLITQKNCFNSYPLDRLAQRLALAALEEPSYYENCAREIVMTREWTRQQLLRLGFAVSDSAANFLWAQHPGLSGPKIYDALREQKILVRRFGTPGLQDHLRITIGSRTDMETFIRASERILEQEKILA